MREQEPNLGYQLAMILREADRLTEDFAEAKREYKQAMQSLKRQATRLMDRIESAEHEFEYVVGRREEDA